MIRHLLLLLIIFLLGLGPTGTSAQVNTEAIDAYWHIVNQLKGDKDPSAAEWQAFFELPGNRMALKGYKRSDSFRDTLRSFIQLVYMPGKREQLHNTRVDVILENIIYTRDQEAAIKAHVAFLKATPAVVDSMYALAYRYLPAHRHKKVKGLKIYYIGPLTPESKALDGAFFINTAMEARFFPKHTVYIGAHELHHLLVRQEAPYKLTTVDQAKYVGVAMIIKSLQREGVADLIDKKHFLPPPHDTIYRPLMAKSLLESDSLILKLNAELERAGSSPTHRPQVRTLISRGGHTPGHYMALVIERNGHLPELLQNIDKPFSFLYTYNKAAQKDARKPALFSPAAIAFLQRVEKLFP